MVDDPGGRARERAEQSRASVDFPDPFGPRTTVTVPASKRALTPTSARTGPYVLVTARSSTRQPRTSAECRGSALPPQLVSSPPTPRRASRRRTNEPMRLARRSGARATLGIMTAAAALIAEELPALQTLRQAVEGALEGKHDAVELALVALLARGHLLIEDVPGVGKTTLARALAQGRRRRAPPRAVHERPSSERRPRRLRLRPAAAASSSSAKGPSSRTSSSPTRSTAPARARSRRCSRP